MSFDQPAIATPEKKDAVDTESSLYLKMKTAGNWDLMHDLLAGTQVMRDAGERWLPREEAEKSDHYKIRLGRSFLFGGFQDAIEKLSAKPFSKAVSTQAKGALPDSIEPLISDVDRTGRSLTQFAKDLFISGITYGATHVIVDFPKVPEGASKADEAAIGVRPNFIHIEPPNLLGWRTDESGQLTQIRYFEETVEEDGDYRDRIVKRIRVLTTKSFEVWEEKKVGDKDVFVLVETGTHTFGRIPLVTCYFNQEGFLTAMPPLLDLAWSNLNHWQSASDHKNILRTLGLAILFGKGFNEEEVQKGINIGPRNLIHTTNTEANLSYVEHSGKGIEALERHLRNLRDEMEFLGLQPLIQKAGNVTATAISRDEGKTLSLIQAWIRSLESCIESCYGLAAEWLKVQLPSEFKVNVFNEFGLSLKAKDDVDSLLKSRQSGQISHATFLNEIKRRGLLSEIVDVKEEIASVEAEGPALGMIGEEIDDDE